MKKTVLKFGLISGAISAALMFGTVPFADRIGFGAAEVLGYATIVLSLMMVFFGVRSYRDIVAGGSITFGRAFTVGILITVLSCTCYVVAWEILYFNFMPDFMDKYSASMTERAKASGASPQEIEAQLQQINKVKELYANPFFNAAMTFMEPFPVGLVVTLLVAAILRKKPDSNLGEVARVT